jgi:hypothetical protein
VTTDSSGLDDGHDNWEKLNADHRDMCRFTGSSDVGYQSTKRVIKRFVEEIEKKAAREIVGRLSLVLS